MTTGAPDAGLFPMMSQDAAFGITAFVFSSHSGAITEAGLRVADQLRPGDPREIGPYRLTGWLGGGGMGEVFLGKSAGGRLVAVKLIRPELAADHEFRTRFRREVAAARRVNGLYTALVAGADTEGRVPWLATAYVRGPSLKAAVEGYEPLPARSVLALAAGLAEGLDEVHAVGLVHRDVKPSNVLLSVDGPRLIDFGIAWDAQSTVLTAAGTIFGSPEFMSPEYATGQRFGPPTDVFSLGAVLVYAATGRPPFQGSSLATVIGRIVTEEPDLRGVPAEVRPIVAWCLAKDPAARPTPKELVARVGDAGLWDDWLPEPLLADIPGRRVSPGSPRRQPDEDTQTMRDVQASDPVPAPAPAFAPPPPVPPPVPPPSRPAAVQPAAAEPVARAGRRRPAIPAITMIAAAAVAVVAAAGAGLWLTLGPHGGTAKPKPSRSATSTPTGATAVAVTSPYQFAVSGETERPCSTVIHSSGGTRAASIIFADKTKATRVLVYWVDYQGKKSLIVTLKPGVSERISGDVGNAWQLAGPGGCIGDFTTTAAGRVTVENKKA
jgi:eukaryotic-like serine/threonine-protein kinase